jgi:hypothetical protein
MKAKKAKAKKTDRLQGIPLQQQKPDRIPGNQPAQADFRESSIGSQHWSQQRKQP